MADNEPGASRALVATDSLMHVHDTFGKFDFCLGALSSQLSHCPSNLTSPSEIPLSALRIYIVCFHLPVRLYRDAQTASWTAGWGESLIARTDGSVAKDLMTHWVGTVCGATEHVDHLHEDQKEQIRNVLSALNCTPLFISESTIDGAYLGYCKQILWPSFHNVDILDLTCACWKPTHSDPAFVWDQAANEHWWEAYVSLNYQFCNAIAGMIGPSDIVWVHDYHLMLLPNMLSQAEAGNSAHRARIVFFLHIPFPTSQIFRCLTRGPELLRGMVGADVVGFHAFEHARHFLNACKRLMGLSHQSVPGGLTGVEYQGRTVMVIVRHVSIEPKAIARALEAHVTVHAFEELLTGFRSTSASCITAESRTSQAVVGKRIVFASVDSCQRLSGLALKLLAFERFLWEYERWRGKVALVQLAILEGKRRGDESRTSSEVTKLVLRLNTAFPGAIHYYELPPSTVTLQKRISLWRHTAVLVGTAIREGLNLAPFEFIFTRQAPLTPGLILASEFSATASLLNGALRLNPFDLSSSAATLDSAVSMPQEERAGRHARDLPYVLSRPAGQWTREVLHDMRLVSGQHRISVSLAEESAVPLVGQNDVKSSPVCHCLPLNCDNLARFYSHSRQRVVFLDLGGTLIERGERVGKYLKQNLNRPIQLHARNVLPQAATDILLHLSEHPSTTVYVVSGVTMPALMMSLGHLPCLGLAASNGLSRSLPHTNMCGRFASRSRTAVHKRVWSMADYSIDWSRVKEAIVPVLRWFTARTNGSAVLTRGSGVAWSYYRTDPEWGRIQAGQLITELNWLLASFHVRVHHSEGMIDIAPQRLRKGVVVKEVLAQNMDEHGGFPDLVLCMGDGDSDESMFASVYSFLAENASVHSTTRAFVCTVGDKPSLAAFFCADHHQVGLLWLDIIKKVTAQVARLLHLLVHGLTSCT